MVTNYESALLSAYEQNTAAGWFGSIGLSFSDLLSARRYAAALATIAGVENITDPNKAEPNKNGIICVWCEPKTATAAALVECLQPSFCELHN